MQGMITINKIFIIIAQKTLQIFGLQELKHLENG